MSSNVSNSKREIIEQAATWYARISADDVTLQDCEDLEAWLEQDTEHRRVFELTESTLGMLRSLGDDPRLQALHDSAPGIASQSEDAKVVPLRSGRRRTWALQPRQMALAASVLVALFVPMLYFMGSQEVPEETSYETAVGERKAIDLEDGSSIMLNTDSHLTVMFSEDERNVVLWSGDLFVEVAKDPDRFFTVNVGAHRGTVTGTALDIRFRDDPARVTVHEGRVRIALTVDDSGSGKEVELGAGQQLTLLAGATPTQLADDELSKTADWRNGLLHFERSTLAEVVRELEPYLDIPIVLTSRKVEELDVGGSLNVDDVDSMLTALESLLPIQVTRESDRIIIRHEADATSP